jgi:predicted nucleic acid-binding protein
VTKTTTTINVPRYVIDASVAVKWHLRDEPNIIAADFLLRDFRANRIYLLAPDHIRHEIASALRKTLRTRRMTPGQARAAVSRFLSLQIPTINDDDLILAGFDQAARFGCSLYDGLYLALAEISNCPVIIADQRLHNAIAGKFPLALWIDNYRPAITT